MRLLIKMLLREMHLGGYHQEDFYHRSAIFMSFSLFVWVFKVLGQFGSFSWDMGSNNESYYLCIYVSALLL